MYELKVCILIKWRRRYYLPWIVSTIFMFGMSYLWHGVILNDFSEINYPLPLFYFLGILVYSFIGILTITAVTQMDIHPKKWLNGILVGSVLGFFIYLIAFVLGISFSSDSALEHVIFDIMWQMIEQSFGGMICGYLYTVYKELRKAEAFQ